MAPAPRRAGPPRGRWIGRVQERDQEVLQIRSGDSVYARPGVWHWHGAGPDTFMTHIADSHGEYTVWGDPVFD